MYRIGSIDRKIARIDLAYCTRRHLVAGRWLLWRYSTFDDFVFILLKALHDPKNFFFSKFMVGAQQLQAAG